MKTEKALIGLAFLCIVIFGIFVYMIGDHDGHYENQEYRYRVSKKYAEPEATNTHGDFEMVHYLYMTDGTLKEVDLEDYLSIEVGDSVSFTERFWVEDKKK